MLTISKGSLYVFFDPFARHTLEAPDDEGPHRISINVQRVNQSPLVRTFSHKNLHWELAQQLIA